MVNSRRNALITIVSALSAASMSKVLATTEVLLATPNTGSFDFIYNYPTYKNEFLNFLVNVFHLYPEKEMHAAISDYTNKKSSDEEIYKALQENLSSIKPLLADITYALPALVKQKKVISAQTSNLLGTNITHTGYLEVGSNGRYLDSLEDALDIQGDIFFLSEASSTYSPIDVIDRGQIFKAGKDIAMNNYTSALSSNISSGSIDLVTVYIGFHHCPLNLREEFITSIRDTMSKDGSLILRDHNVHNGKMWHMVALAHDVFNMGTKESWEYNNAELRHFYSLDMLNEMLIKFGFIGDGRRLYQDGDPTLNALMIYKKT
jgi:hypothetical protein